MDDGLDTLAELIETFFIDGWRELKVFFVFPPLGVSYVRCLLLRDEMKNMPLSQPFQGLIDLLRFQGGLTGEETLVDVVVVGKEAAVVSQQGCDDLIFVGGIVLQLIEFTSRDGEHQAGLIVLFLRIFDVAGASEYLQG